MTSTLTDAPRRRNTLSDIRHGTSTFDFTHRLWRWVAISGLLVVISIGALAFKGLNLGIEFTGGVSWTVQVANGKNVTTEGARAVVQKAGANDATIQILTRNDGSKSIRVEATKVPSDKRAAVRVAIAEYAGQKDVAVSLSEVSSSWGRQVSLEAIKALIVFLAFVVIYLTLRLEWKMAVAAIVAVIHDVIITVGIYALFGFVVTPATVVAFLTILGYSLYDTVVVFDKVKENQRTLGHIKGETYSDMVNRSANQVLMRSLNTSFVALLPVLSLLLVGTVLLGAYALVEFALALGIGLTVGAYSSIFVATPLFAWMKEKEPRNRALRERVQAAVGGIGAKAAPASSGADGAGDDAAGGTATAVTGGPATMGDRVIQPRPRKKQPKKPPKASR